MIEHRECNEQVRDRVCAEPSLIEHSHSIRGVIYLACITTLPIRESSEFVLPQIFRGRVSTAVQPYSMGRETEKAHINTGCERRRCVDNGELLRV
jgi:hypothetical protein